MTIEETMAAMTAVIDGADGRTLTDDEVTQYEALEGDLAAAQADAGVRSRQVAYATPVGNVTMAVNDAGDDGPVNPLAFTSAALDELQAAIRERRTAQVGHDLRIENVVLTTGTVGSRRVWGANVLAGPRILHVVAGVPTQPADAIFAQFPKLTIPAPSPSVGEGISLVEYDSSTLGNVTLGRFGRFSDLSGESLIGADSGAITAMHRVGIAKDLDDVLITATETAAGVPVAFNADVPAAIRTAIARVVDKTAMDSAMGLVVLTHPDDAALLQDVAPTGGNTIGEGFQRFSGALVYPSSSVATGFMTVANLAAGARYFEAAGTMTATDTDVKTGVVTAATAVVSGYATTLAGGYAVQVDVVTP